MYIDLSLKYLLSGMHLDLPWLLNGHSGWLLVKILLTYKSQHKIDKYARCGRWVFSLNCRTLVQVALESDPKKVRAHSSKGSLQDLQHYCKRPCSYKYLEMWPVPIGNMILIYFGHTLVCQINGQDAITVFAKVYQQKLNSLGLNNCLSSDI